MRLVIREPLLTELRAIESKHEQLQGTLQSDWTTRKVARFSGKACNVMAYFSSIAFDRVGHHGTKGNHKLESHQ